MKLHQMTFLPFFLDPRDRALAYPLHISKVSQMKDLFYKAILQRNLPLHRKYHCSGEQRTKLLRFSNIDCFIANN